MMDAWRILHGACVAAGGVACWDYVNRRGKEGNREESGMAKKKRDNAVTTWF
jgi:hypothetical protein